MRYGEGNRALFSRSGKEFLDMLSEIRWDLLEDGQVEEGAILFRASMNKTEQEFYAVKSIERIEEERYYLKIHKLTPTGRKAKRGNVVVSFRKRLYGYGWYKLNHAYDVTREVFENYLDRNKNYVASGKSRDSQKTKVFRSEWNLPKEIRDVQVGNSEDVIQEYINRVITNSDVRSINPDVSLSYIKFKLNNRRKGGIAFSFGIIECANTPFGKSKITVLHEVAHFLAPDTHHGKQFTTNLLKLLKIEFPEAFVALKENYDYYGVSYDNVD